MSEGSTGVIESANFNLSTGAQATQYLETPNCLSSRGTEQNANEPVAIVGFSAKFPQDATSPDAFWQLLMEGRSAMSEVPSDRFNIDSFYHRNGDRLDTVHYDDTTIRLCMHR